MAESTATQRENEIIEHVTKAFANRLVSVAPITVHTLEGGESLTLRFTIDDVSSTDLKRERIAAGAESSESLAREVEEELKKQLAS
jgi:hypothetical protein